MEGFIQHTSKRMHLSSCVVLLFGSFLLDPSCCFLFRFCPLGRLLPAHKLYPVRVRLVNDVSDTIEWVTVAYVPIVRKLQEAGADERARIRRCGILKRVIYAAFTNVIGRSHIGFRVKVNSQRALAFPRVLLYLCDQPEERAVLGLKGGQCAHPCTSCMAKIDVISAPEAVTADERNVINTLTNQMEAYEHTRRQRQRQRRLALGALQSTSGGVPGLAAMAGLGTAPLLLYNMIGFDVLHVSCRSGAPSCVAVCFLGRRAPPWCCLQSISDRFRSPAFVCVAALRHAPHWRR